MFLLIRTFLAGFDIPRWLVYALLTAAVLLFTGWQGYRLGAAKLDRYKVEQLTEATRINTARQAVTERVQIQFVEVAGKTEFVTRWIEKEVSDYAAENPDGLCLDPEWRRLHDRAALNAIPDPASGANAALRATGRAAEGLRPTDRR